MTKCDFETISCDTCFDLFSLCKEFIAQYGDKELQRLPTIVAMDTMRRNTSNSSIVSYLIMASESGEIIILDTQSFVVLQHVRTVHCICSH